MCVARCIGGRVQRRQGEIPGERWEAFFSVVKHGLHQCFAGARRGRKTCPHVNASHTSMCATKLVRACTHTDMHVLFFLGIYICIYMYMYACFQERVCRAWRRWIATGFIRDGVYYFVASVSKQRYGQWACQPCQYQSSEAMSLPAFANEFEDSKCAYWSCNVSSKGMWSVHDLVFVYYTHEAIWAFVGIRCCVTSSAWDTDPSKQLAREYYHARHECY
jgi:hypothetical protein